jgi:thioredoxin 1
MNIPYYEEGRGPLKIIEPSKRTATSGDNAAKFSIVAAVGVIGMNWAGITVLKGRSAALSVAEFAAIVAVLAGLASAVTALVKALNHRGKSVIPLAAAGLLLNGALIATGFVKAPILGRQETTQKKVSAKKAGTPPVTLKSGRTIVTQDWTAGSVFEVTDSTFDTVIGGTDIPILVDFWAPWCGPCRKMSPVIEELARDYKGKAKVYKLNIDNSSEITGRFGISGIPTIILFKGGHIQKKWVGVTDKEDISAAIEREL